MGCVSAWPNAQFVLVAIYDLFDEKGRDDLDGDELASGLGRGAA